MDLKKFNWRKFLVEVIRLAVTCGLASAISGCKCALFNL